MDAESRTTAVAEAPEKVTELTGNTSRTYKFIKRAFDIAASVVGLILCIPIFLVVGIAIKVEDPKGTVFYHQPRIGLNGREFTFYKLRSMYTNADAIKATLMDRNEMDGPVFKIKDDPRVTKVGRFIRKTSIDELPQLWNVLHGDMSLVGPRPLPVAEELACSAYQRQRELVKPGLTCYWQVSGRSAITFYDWIELDLKYIREQNTMTDMKILAKTVGAVVHGGGSILGVSVCKTETRRPSIRLPRVLKMALCFPLMLAMPSGGTAAPGQTKEKRQHVPVKPNTSKGYVFCKRAFDVTASALALIILSPVFLITAIAIKLEDHGPVFYSNYLVGKDEKKFPIHKFRSMYVNAVEINVSAHEEKDAAGITFKLANDPRVTKVGKIIRRICIDELPQLINILKGEMSFVGPRPLPPYADAQLSAYDRNRYKVKGGLLCFWQISDRSKVSFEEWMDMDIRYVNEASVWTDFKILLMTVPAVFMTIWKNY